MWSLVIVLAVCLTASVRTHWLEQGDQCETWKGTTGICSHYLNCPIAAEGVQANGPLEICNYEGIYPIVCCEFDNSAVSPPLILAKPAYNITQNTGINVTKHGGIFFEGGRDARIKEFPHMALLGYGERNNIQWVCGGSLISKEFVLTAAHCLNSIFGKLRYIRLGEFDYSTTTDDADPQNFTVRNTYPHPKYISPSYYHDIALVRLDRPVRINDYVKPACLGLTKNLTNHTPVAMGWGTTSYGGALATILQAGQLAFVSNEICRTFYGEKPAHKIGIVDEIQVCADGGGLKMDTCQGDSGGPLQIMNFPSKCQEIVGITSFGQHCALVAAVYTRVYPYTSWIKAIVQSVE